MCEPLEVAQQNGKRGPGPDLARPRRRNHWWGAGDREADGTLTSACGHCGLVERHGYYLGEDGQTLDVIQWITPRGKLLRIRPIVDIRPSSKATQTIADAFPDVPVGEVPECPKSIAGWEA